MSSHAVPIAWKEAFEARLREHNPALRQAEIGITQVAWEEREIDDPVVCADQAFCAIDDGAREWVYRCARRLIQLDRLMDRYTAHDMATALWSECRHSDPVLAASLGDPERARCEVPDPIGISEGEWVERFMARVGELTKPGQVDPLKVAERGKWAWLSMTTFTPELVASELYGYQRTPGSV